MYDDIILGKSDIGQFKEKSPMAQRFQILPWESRMLGSLPEMWQIEL